MNEEGDGEEGCRWFRWYWCRQPWLGWAEVWADRTGRWWWSVGIGGERSMVVVEDGLLLDPVCLNMAQNVQFIVNVKVAQSSAE